MKEGDDILRRAFDDPVEDTTRLARDLADLQDVEVSIFDSFPDLTGELVEEVFKLDPAWGPIETQRRLDEWQAGRYSLSIGLPMPPGLEGLAENEIYGRRIEALSPEGRRAYGAYLVHLFEKDQGPGGP